MRTLLRHLPFLAPLEPSNLFGHLAATAVPGVEEWRDGRYRAAVRLPGGPAVVAVRPPAAGASAIEVDLRLADAADEPLALARVRGLLDLGTDPVRMAAVLGADPVLRPLLDAVPGRRVPGTLDPAAMALRAVLGQQVATASARTLTGRLVAALGEPLREPSGGLTHLFPEPTVIVARADAARDALRMPESRRRTVLTVAAALADGTVDLAAAPATVRTALLALPGVGPWTADTVLMRALGDSDAFLAGDLGVVLAARRLGLPDRTGALERRSRDWSPYRSHAVQYLWATGTHPVNVLPG